MGHRQVRSRRVTVRFFSAETIHRLKMQRQVYNPALLSSVFYACLIFASMHDPGLLIGAMGQAIACVCICAVLMLLVGYRDEIADLAKAAFQAHGSPFSLFLRTEETWPPESGLIPPAEPAPVSLFQRPPPSLV